MILTIVILVLFVLFWAADAVAHFTNYRFGPTLSALLWRLENDRRKAWAMIFRVSVGVLVALLFTHLEFQIP